MIVLLLSGKSCHSLEFHINWCYWFLEAVWLQAVASVGCCGEIPSEIIINDRLFSLASGRKEWK